jgi:hypothetical protein
MPSIGQTWVLATIGAVVEMGILSTLKRLLMESRAIVQNVRYLYDLYQFLPTSQKASSSEHFRS